MKGTRHIWLVLARHTQSTMNLQQRYTGSRGYARLTDEGLVQADGLGKFIADQRKAKAIYASDLLRTRQTAALISAHHERPLRTVYTANLREVDVGAMTGLTKKEARAMYPDDQFKTRFSGFDFSPIGGETAYQVYSRQLETARRIAARYGSKDKESAPDVVVVGHGSSLHCLLRNLKVGEDPVLHDQGSFQPVLFTLHID